MESGELRFSSSSVFREEPEGGILFDVDTGRLKLVEGTAWGICALIDQGSTRQMILEKLRSRYPNEPDLQADLEAFLKELASEGFLCPVPGGGGFGCS